MKPEFVAQKSGWAAVSFWRILSCILIIPIPFFVLRILTARAYRIEFYADKIIVHSGFLTVRKKDMIFSGVLTVSTEQSLWGQLCNYGTVVVDAVGKWDVGSTYIKHPEKLEAYLQTRIVNVQPNTHVHMGL